MKIRNLMLASTALALLGGAQTAQADMYVSVFGGANFLEDSSDFGGTPNDFFAFGSDADIGFALGGAVGVHLDKWAKGLRAELEASYRRQDVGGVWSSDNGPFTSGPIDANQSTFAIMANVWYDFDCGWKIMPYAGGGVGWGRARVDGALLTSNGTQDTFIDRENGFAWQLGAGFNYEVQPGVNLGLGYRYFEGPTNDLIFNGKNTLRTEIENGNHSVLVHLIIDTN